MPEFPTHVNPPKEVAGTQHSRVISGIEFLVHSIGDPQQVVFSYLAGERPCVAAQLRDVSSYMFIIAHNLILLPVLGGTYY